MIGNPNDETNFPHKLLLSNTQVSNLQQILSYQKLDYLMMRQKWNGGHYEIVKSLEDFGILLKGVSETIKVKEQKGGLF